MLYTPLTKKALQISFDAHKDQTDKSGLPYVYHPYEVASGLQTETEVCVALLHDVVEDTDITFEQLKEEGFGDDIIFAIKLMTHQKGVPYFDYVRAIKENPIAKSVKLSDLKHNSIVERLDQISDRDRDRIKKYQKAIDILLE